MLLTLLLIYLCSSIIAGSQVLSVASSNVPTDPANIVHSDASPSSDNEHAGGGVSVVSGLGFLVISTIGLNGEQLLDSIMNIQIRDEHFAGSKVYCYDSVNSNWLQGPGIAKQAITLLSAILALLSTLHMWMPTKSKSKSKSTIALILIWGFAQFIRVFFFRYALTL